MSLICDGVKTILDQTGLILKHEAKNSEFKLDGDRRRTFERLAPQIEDDAAIELSEQGLYVSEGDVPILRCYYCNVKADRHELFDDVVYNHPVDSKCSYFNVFKQHRDNISEASMNCALCEEKYKYLFVLLPCGSSRMCFHCFFRVDICPYDKFLIVGAVKFID